MRCSNNSENEAAVAIEKQAPRSVAPAALQLDHPGVQGRSLRGVRPDIALDVADCNRGVAHDRIRRTAAAELLRFGARDATSNSRREKLPH
jgi:hypothetical protein